MGPGCPDVVGPHCPCEMGPPHLGVMGPGCPDVVGPHCPHGMGSPHLGGMGPRCPDVTGHGCPDVVRPGFPGVMGPGCPDVVGPHCPHGMGSPHLGGMGPRCPDPHLQPPPCPIEGLVSRDCPHLGLVSQGHTGSRPVCPLLSPPPLEPPKVTLHPTPLVVAPGQVAELRCETSGYFPLDVGVRWQRRAGDSGTSLPLEDTVAETWSSGHRRGADGTFSRSSGARLVPARPHHHGDVYTCVVAHGALATPLRAHVRLEVAGATGPCLEDVVGLFLVAFVLCGLWRWLSPARE
uniref:Ig-like domain-containing protein n=1 Tax=Strix occidentalis caurina TaxID=311401 RepID=A0A8D0FPM0_STROC